MKRTPFDDSLRCSFCRKTQDAVGKLISNPSDYPRAYICDECIAVCHSIIEDDREEQSGMTSLDAIKEAMGELSESDCAALTAWLNERDSPSRASQAGGLQPYER